MSSGIFQPSNQIKLTNVSVIRLKKGGKRFEIAAYKNKVMEYRNGVEKDLDNVLQTNQIFTNVSKGTLASKEDLEKCFKTQDEEIILLQILNKGELQVSTLERNNQLENLHKDVISIITSNSVNPETKRPYPTTMIEKVVADLHYNLNSTKSAKQQAMEIIKQLQSLNVIPIARAQMKVKIILPTKEAKKAKDKLDGWISQLIDEDYGNSEYNCECLIDPGQFRVITEYLQSEMKGRGRIELLALADVQDGDEVF